MSIEWVFRKISLVFRFLFFSKAFGGIKASALLLSVFYCVSAHAITEIALSENFPTITLSSKHFQFIEDKTGNLSVEAIFSGQAPWQDISDPDVIGSWDDSFYWFKLEVNNRSPELQRIILAYDYAHSKTVDVYLVHKGRVIKYFQAGDGYPYDIRPIDEYLPAFPFSLEAKQPYQLVVRIQGRAKNFTYLSKVYSYDSYIRESPGLNLGFWLGVGACITIIVFNSIVGLASKQSSYLWFVGVVFLYILIEAFIQGVGFKYFWPDSLIFHERVLFVAAMLRYLMIGMFAVTLLSWKTEMPRMYLVVCAVNIVTLLLAISHLISPISYFMQFIINAFFNVGFYVDCPIYSVAKEQK